VPTFSKDDVSGKYIYRKTDVNPDDEFNATTTTTTTGSNAIV
jgi:hypothetical protein